MCGIAGIFSFNGHPLKNLKSRIYKMTKMLRHRGPDQEGIFISNDNLCAIGNTRLAITDPKYKMELPLISRNKNNILTYNGEIFNYEYLRKYLISKGIPFKTKTDTEVLLEGLVLEGLSFLSKADGMWAFGLYNKRKKELILSRDLLGERHLFYSISDGVLYFASEPLPIIHELKKKDLKIDDESVINAMLFNGCAPGKSLIKNIKRLLPGRNIIAKINKNPTEILFKKLHPEKWFDFFSKKPNEKKIFETFNNILSESLTLRTPKDVPYISALSGGVDSAIVSLYMSKFGKKKTDTIFLNSFGNIYTDKFTEQQAMRITSSKLHTSNREIEFNHEENIKIFLKESKNSFDGLFDCSFIVYRQLANAIRKDGKKVIFMSDALDESLGGYLRDYDSWKKDIYFASRKTQLFIFKILSKSRYARSILRKIGMKKFIINYPNFRRFNFSPMHSFGDPDFISKIVHEKKIKDLFFTFGTIDNIYDDVVKELDFTQKMSLSYLTKSVPDWFNLRSDKGFFGSSIECRLPFQDPKLVEFLIGVPPSLRFAKKKTKVFARNVVNNFISPKVAHKQKAGLPFSTTNLRSYENKLQIEDTLRNSEIFDYFPFKKNVKNIILDPKYGFKKFLWTFYCLSRTTDNLKKIRDS